MAGLIKLRVLERHKASAIIDVLTADSLHLGNHLSVLLQKPFLQGVRPGEVRLVTRLLVNIFELGGVVVRRLRNLRARFNLDIDLALLGYCNGR